MKHRLPFYLTLLILAVSIFLRFYQLDTVPFSPYWEEVALGYDAYSILQTGRDHHGQFLPIVAFKSFGDYKPALYFYAIVPFLTIFHLSVMAVRFPAALSGIFIVWGVGKLIELIEDLTQSSKNRTKRNWLPILGMAITAISPWAILFSRGGWEVNLATALILWGVNFYFLYQQRIYQQSKFSFFWLLVAVFSFVLSMYTYHSARIVAPLLGVGLAIISLSRLEWKVLKLNHKIQPQFKQLMMGGLVAVILLLPILASLGSVSINHRLAETSIFSDLTVIEESNARKEFVQNSIASRLFYHRYLLFGKEVITQFISHFSPQFLFLSGDLNPRHSIQYFGQFYYVDIIFLFLGAFILLKKRSRYVLFLFGWLAVGIIPAAISSAAPHALRILPTLPVWMVLITYGIAELIKRTPLRLKKMVIFTVIGMYAVESVLFWRAYSAWYPVKYSAEWQYGYQSLVTVINQQLEKYPDQPIFISRYRGRPAMYYWFYSQTDPKQIQEIDSWAEQDQGEFLAYQNLVFFNNLDQINLESGGTVAGSVEEIHSLVVTLGDQQYTREATIMDPLGKVIWQVIQVDPQ